MSVNFENLFDSDRFLGPTSPDKKPVRGQYRYKLNETASVGNIAHEPYNEPAGKGVVVKVTAVTKPKFAEITRLLDSYETAISQHIERRVICFFFQLVDCFHSHISFKEGWTLHQGESSKPLVIREEKESQLVASFTHQSAHSSTLPCLIAVGKDGKERLFLFGSSHYTLWNTTMALPKAVNDADREIDEKTMTSILRKRAIAIVNQAAKGKIDPVAGTKKFIDEAVKITTTRLGQVKDPGVKKVLHQYKKELLEVKVLTEKPEFFDRLLELEMAKEHRGKKMELVLRHASFRSIRHVQLAQTLVAHRINQVCEELHTQLTAGGRKMDNFVVAFNRILLKKLPLPRQKSLMQRVFNTMPHNYATRGVDRAEKAIHTQIDTILQLTKAIGFDLDKVRDDETSMRQQLLVEFREGGSYSRKGFEKAISKVDPSEPASTSTVWRMETGIRTIPRSFIKALCKVFGVKEFMFSPAYFLKEE